MPIVRDDCDMLVFEAQASETGKPEQMVGLAVLPLMALVACGVALQSGWSHQLAVGLLISIGLALAGGAAAAFYFLWDSSAYISCLAIDRAARRVLCVSKTLRRTTSEEIDFNQIENVTTELVTGRHCRWWLVSLRLVDVRGRARLTCPLARRLGEQEADALAAKLLGALGRPTLPRPPAEGLVARWFVRLMKFAIGAVGIAVATAIALNTLELWQAPAWPKTTGVVEAVELGKKLRKINKREQLADAIEIVYRYSVGGVEYRNTRFNFAQNWLFPPEVKSIRQRYRLGHACQVSYNPRDPARSVLVATGSPAELYSSAVLATLFALAGASWLGYHAWQMARGKPAAAREPPAGLVPRVNA
ncbi:MAG TPA: DUF3592 domain-containing protein [Pirellulales bacterium]|nr:DUF3592 domain-containing protein [Pirellulales bacterium]